jgi:hypothetical protein
MDSQLAEEWEGKGIKDTSTFGHLPQCCLPDCIRYSRDISTLTLNIEKEFESIDPEDALHIQRALLEMLQLARRKKAVAKLAASKPEKYTLPSWNLGVRPGLDLTKLAHVDEDDQAE